MPPHQNMSGAPEHMAFQQPQRSSEMEHLRIVRKQSQEPRYVHFGALQQSLRDRVGYTLKQFIEAIVPAFREADVPELGVKTYGNLERDERYPHYQELWPLLRGMVECCRIQFSAQDGRDFYRLARLKIDASKKWRRSEADWHQLEQDINAYIGALQEEHLPRESEETAHVEAGQKEERQRILRQLDQDTSHILGRELWLECMLSYLEPKAATTRNLPRMQEICRS